jgi:hypothetical protein
MGRNTQVASVQVDCKRLMLLGGSLFGKTPVIHNLTTYKHEITFQYHIMSKIPNNLIINTAKSTVGKRFYQYAEGMGTWRLKGHDTIEKSQTVAIKSKSCIPR